MGLYVKNITSYQVDTTYAIGLIYFCDDALMDSYTAQ